MIKKKILLVALLTLPTSALLIAEDNDIIATTMNDEDTLDMSQFMPQEQDMSIANEQEENEILLEQRFICQQEGQEEGVVCQMYECINNDCQISTPIKINNEQSTTNDITAIQEEPILTDSTESEMLPPEEEQEKLMPEKEESTDSIMTSINVSSHDNEEIRELKTEIKSAEKTCERAESDPLEKEICERASANVQWRKEKIKALENADVR